MTELDKMTRCSICPRACAVARPVSGQGGGFCGFGQNPVLARAGLHLWEEPCVSGTRGSGTVFFSGCNLRCRFCQNREISAGKFGREVTPAQLRKIFLSLISQGAHNINLVTPTHFVPAITEALSEPLPVPVIYNCGGYESVQTLRALEGYIDVYMPDFKYSLAEPAKKYSGAADYPETAFAAIKEMLRQRGKFVLDDDGMLVSGVLIRHLILPGNLENTLGVIDSVKSFGDDVLFSLMSQYTPPTGGCGIHELDRRLTQQEYEAAEQYLFDSGIENGFVQELDSASEAYIPEFDLTGVDVNDSE